jgi:hypothetical protein
MMTLMEDHPRNPSGRQPLASADLADAAGLLRGVLALVAAGELEAKTTEARALLRRVEGAALAVAIAAGEQPHPTG